MLARWRRASRLAPGTVRRFGSFVNSTAAYVNTSSSVKADEKLMRSLSAVGQTLKVRAVCVDAQLFRRTGGAERVASPLAFASLRGDPASIATKDMLTKAVRQELKDRGLDSIGKPWAVRERLDQARSEADELAGLESAIGGAAPEKREKETKQRPEFGGGVAAKYAAKLAAKRNGATAPVGAAAASAGGDAAILSGARELAALDDARRNDSKWRMGPPGMKSLLTFAAARSMSIALVARPDTPDGEVDELLKQAGVTFDVVARAADDALGDALAALDLAPHQVLSFCDDLDSVLQGKRRRLHTCVLDDDDVPLPARHDRRPDFNVAKCSDVCHVINDLNGISWRAPGPA